MHYIPGLLQFDGFTLRIKPYSQLSGVPLSIPQALDEFTKFYKSQLLQVQKLLLLVGSNKILKELWRGVANVLSPISRPLTLGYSQGSARGVVVGFGLGLQDATKYLTEEGWKWSTSLVGFLR